MEGKFRLIKCSCAGRGAEMGRAKKGGTGGRKSVEQTECRVCVERIIGGGVDERGGRRGG